MSRLVIPSAGQRTLSKLVSGSLRPAISQCALALSVLSSLRAALSSGSWRCGGPSPPSVARLPAAPPRRPVSVAGPSGKADFADELRVDPGRGLRRFRRDLERAARHLEGAKALSEVAQRLVVEAGALDAGAASHIEQRGPVTFDVRREEDVR